MQQRFHVDESVECSYYSVDSLCSSEYSQSQMSLHAMPQYEIEAWTESINTKNWGQLSH